jgi:hypothetical protein
MNCIVDNEPNKLKFNLISDSNPSPFLFLDHLARLHTGEIWISNITEVEYPFPTSSSPNQKILSKVIYFITPYVSENGKQTGFNSSLPYTITGFQPAGRSWQRQGGT